MTMDVNHRKAEMRTNGKVEETKATTKRPFDVAFLMLPNDKCKRQEKTAAESQPDSDEDEEIEVGNSYDYPKTQQKATKQQAFDETGFVKAKSLDELRQKSSLTGSSEKSAFTKVNLVAKEVRSLSVSPDLSYQNSLSPSPPSRAFPAALMSPNQLFKHHQQLNAYHGAFEGFHHHAAEGPFLLKQPAATMLPRARPAYRPELPYGYPHQPYAHSQADVLKMSAPAEIRHPAAAILSSLLPPSLAALSLPSQNVCAKCNVSFRMTSDLVYHMRSHHKNDAMDVHKRRREDKLKCPVCAESFRERHHLTRHMTAHQDKDEDDVAKTTAPQAKR